MPDPIAHHTVTFDWQKVVSQVLTDAPGIVDVEYEVRPELVFDRMVHQLKARVLSHKLPAHEVTELQRVEFEFPASPWQHWKQRHGGSWWLRWLVRWRPVRTETVVKTVGFTAVWEQMAVYPWQMFAPTAKVLGRAQRIVQFVSNQEIIS